MAMSAFILMAIFTTSGTFMLLFIAALQGIAPEVHEAALLDRTNAWQRFWHVTLPMLKPTLFTVLTLGLIGTWQVFDQIYTGTGWPRKDDPDARLPVVQRGLQPAGLGRGRRDRVLLFAIIVAFTMLQRWVLRDRDKVKRTKTRDRAPARSGGGGAMSSRRWTGLGTTRPGRARRPRLGATAWPTYLLLLSSR